METDLSRKIIAASCFVGLLVWALRILNWAWFTPRRLEKILRSQGFTGNPYRFLVGDITESTKMLEEVMSKPMKLNNDIVPRIMPHVDETIKTYGPNSFTWVGRIPRVHIMDPDQIKAVLTHASKFQKNFDLHNPLARFLLTGLGSYEGEKWARHRKIISPAFTLEKLKDMIPAFGICYDELLTEWEKIATKEGSCEADVYPIFDTLTSDVIARVGFGSNYTEGAEIFKCLKQLNDLTILVMRDLYIPGWSYLPTPRNKLMKEINNRLRDQLRNVINKRSKAMKEGEPTEDDLLGVLLEANSQEIAKQGNKKSAGMTLDDVIEECKLFYFAGQETTGILLAWTMVLLGMNPEWQEKAREEVLQAFGKKKPDFQSLNHIKSLTMIIYEVLRLYPPVTDLTKFCQEETRVGPYTIPPGVQVMLPTALLHRDKTIWGEDAMEFNPLRFSEGVASATKNQVTYLPFSWGPRSCLGQNFALLQAKLGLAMILQRFSFELSPSYAHAPYVILTMQPQYGVNVVFRKLEN